MMALIAGSSTNGHTRLVLGLMPENYVARKLYRNLKFHQVETVDFVQSREHFESNLISLRSNHNALDFIY